MAKKWAFPHGRDLTPRGANDPSINSFLDNVIDSLTREVIQNSLDAKIKENNNPVEITFDFDEISTRDIPGIDEIYDTALPLAEEFWRKKENIGTLEYLKSFREVLGSDKIRVLKISDFNTYGLNDKSYDALVLGNGYTEKIDDNAAGSKGIGKAAPFANSDLRLVFYNTVPTNSSPKHVGVLNFVSFNCDADDETIVTQERALYKEEQYKHISGQINFNFKSRDLSQYGTDLFILGFRDTEDDWEKRILLSAVNNFLVSILENKLIVRVNNARLNSDNISEVIRELEELKKSPDEKIIFKNTLNYYDALTNENRLEFELDNRFLAYPFVESKSDGKLILLKREDANRAILQTRISGMKIYDRRNVSGNILFTGVFRATGIGLDKFLKSLENTNHTDWSSDQASKEDRKVAKKLLKDLYDWYKECVKSSYEQNVEDVIDAIGMKDFLPLLSSDSEKNVKRKDSGIKNSINSVEINRNKNKTNNLYNPIEKEVDSILKDLNLDNEKDDRKSKKETSNKKKGILERLGFNQKTKEEKLVDVTQFFGIKIVALNSKEGQYRCILKPKKEFKEIDLKFNFVGEDGTITQAIIRELTSQSNMVKKSNTDFRVLDINKDKRVIIDIKVNSNLLMKMEGKINEIKI
jgi:hypothetical protein